MSTIKWQKIIRENLNLDYTVLLSAEECSKYMSLLESEIRYYDGELARVKIFNKWFPIPRQHVAYGEEGLTYKFSGNCIPAKDWTQTVMELRNIVEQATGYKYNFVLINRYRNGNDYIGEHRDDETEIDKKTPIASLSLGAPRYFQFRHEDRKRKRQPRDVPIVGKILESGSLLLMNYPTNSYWYHSLPKRPSCKEIRINLTFRNLNMT